MIEAEKAAEIAKKRAEASKKLEAAERRLKMQQDMLKTRINLGESIGTKHIDVKSAANEVEHWAKEVQRLK